MNSRNERYIFETARPEDAGEILEILEEIDFKGKISLTFTRRPDPIASFRKEGKRVDILVSRDTREGRITAVAAASINRMFYDGEAADIGYLFGLRVRQEYRRRYLLLPAGFDTLFRLHQGLDIPVYITTILEENVLARRLLEKRRASMPVYEYHGDYETYALATGGRARRTPGFRFRTAERADVPALAAFLREQGRRFQFFPVLEAQELESPDAPVRFHDFTLMLDPDGRILAAGAVWDQRAYKQYILNRYEGVFRLLYPVSFLFPLMRYPRLARPGSILNYFTLAFWAVRDDCPDWFERFLCHLARETRAYDYFVLGVHRRHPLREPLRGKPHLPYKARMYLVHPRDRGPRKGFPDSGRVPYLEIGRL